MANVKVKFITQAGTNPEGSEAEFSAEEAKRLIDGKVAVAIGGELAAEPAAAEEAK